MEHISKYLSDGEVKYLLSDSEEYCLRNTKGVLTVYRRKNSIALATLPLEAGDSLTAQLNYDIQGDRIAVAIRHTVDSDTYGIVRVFHKHESTWVREYDIYVTTGTYFKCSISIAGSHIAVVHAAQLEIYKLTDDAPHYNRVVSVRYTHDPTYNTTSEVALSGNRLAISVAGLHSAHHDYVRVFDVDYSDSKVRRLWSITGLGAHRAVGGTVAIDHGRLIILSSGSNADRRGGTIFSLYTNELVGSLELGKALSRKIIRSGLTRVLDNQLAHTEHTSKVHTAQHGSSSYHSSTHTHNGVTTTTTTTHTHQRIT